MDTIIYKSVKKYYSIIKMNFLKLFLIKVDFIRKEFLLFLEIKKI